PLRSLDRTRRCRRYRPAARPRDDEAGRRATRRRVVATRPASTGTAFHPAIGQVTAGYVPGETGRRRMIEHDLGRQLDPEPLLELDDEEYRSGRVHSQTRESGARVNALGRRLERLGEIRDAPVADLELGRIRLHELFCPSGRLQVFGADDYVVRENA